VSLKPPSGTCRRPQSAVAGQGVGNIRAWLYRVATNVCLDMVRAKERRLPSLQSFRDVPWLEPYPDALLEPASEAERPDLVAVSRETIALAFRCPGSPRPHQATPGPLHRQVLTLMNGSDVRTREQCTA
jgi:RNA polymerase sigma-70 factor (ECF subfamily)